MFYETRAIAPNIRAATRSRSRSRPRPRNARSGSLRHSPLPTIARHKVRGRRNLFRFGNKVSVGYILQFIGVANQARACRFRARYEIPACSAGRGCHCGHRARISARSCLALGPISSLSRSILQRNSNRLWSTCWSISEPSRNQPRGGPSHIRSTIRRRFSAGKSCHLDRYQAINLDAEFRQK